MAASNFESPHSLERGALTAFGADGPATAGPSALPIPPVRTHARGNGDDRDDENRTKKGLHRTPGRTGCRRARTARLLARGGRLRRDQLPRAARRRDGLPRAARTRLRGGGER